MNNPEITKYCTHCGDEFTASRSTATFCSNTCRTKACVQRNHDKRAKADQEKERLQEQKRLQQVADAKRVQREEKTALKKKEKEEIDKIARLAEENKKNQDKKDADNEADQKRRDDEVIQKLKEQKEADKAAQQIIDRIQKAKEELADNNRTKAWIEIAFHAIGGISNLISEKQTGFPQPLSLAKPIEKLSLGYAFPPISMIADGAATKPVEMPKLGYMSLPGISWIPMVNASVKQDMLTSKKSGA
jgi:hypothetical protein